MIDMTEGEALEIWLPIIHMGVKTMPECKEALDMAIADMRKYQKIQEIVKNTDAMAGSNRYACAFIDIKEVVKDGNDNN